MTTTNTIFCKNFHIIITDPENNTIYEHKYTNESVYTVDIKEDFLDFKFKGKIDKLGSVIDRIHKLDLERNIEDLP